VTAAAAETPAPTRASTPDSNFVVQAVSFNDTSPTAGEPVNVSAIVSNEGDEVGTYVAGLQVGDNTVASQGIRLEPGESGRIEFVREFTDPGTHEVGIGSLIAGTVTVEPSSARGTPTTRDGSGTAESGLAAGAESGIELRDATSVYSWVRAGFNGSVRATVVNPGDEPASRELTVRVDGEPVATRTVRLDPGERGVVTVEFPATEGTVTVDGVEAGELRVGGAREPPDTAADASGGTGPGFGPVATLLALVAAGALSAVGRWRRETRGG
jgi:uncharacterized cupredoxin-like copper-binding protein